MSDISATYWAYLAAATAGVLIGAYLRVVALIAASALLAVVLLAAVLSGAVDTIDALAQLALLQLGYLAGLILTGLRSLD